jgi:hypothetical protein
MGRDDELVKPPSFALLATEGRGLLDIPALFAAAPFLAAAPRGEPQPVLVLPGLGADDRSTTRSVAFSKGSGIRSMVGAVAAMFAHPTLTFQRWPRRLRSSVRTPA